MTQPDTRLASAWAAFDKQEWASAARQFAAISEIGHLPPIVAAEAAFALAHANVRAQDDSAAGAPLVAGLTLAVNDLAVRHALVRAWTPRSNRGYGIDIAKLKLSPAPDVIGALQVLALIYETAGDLPGTLKVCHGLWGLGAGDRDLFVKMGRLWMAAGNNAEAARFFRKALRKEEHLPALDGLADVAWLDGDVETVRKMLHGRAAVTTDPAERAAALFKAATVQPVIARNDAEIDAARGRFSDAVNAPPAAPFDDPWQLGLGPNFFVNYQGRDDRALQEAAARYFLAATPSLGAHAAHIDRPRAGDKVRIGFVSNYFNSHTIGYLNRGLILGIDRKRFEVVLFRTPRAHFDAVTQAFGATARVVDLPADLDAARRIIADAALDLLHYPEIGMDYFSYFLAFARLAKVQTVGWGHPVTTGIPAIDLFLSADAMEPANGAQHYSERLVRLKSLSIDVARPELKEPAASRAELGIEANRPAYVCAQSLYKVHHDFDATIALILQQDRDGIIYFISHGGHADELFRKRLAARLAGDIARVRVLPRVTPERFLHLLRAADVLLDVPQWSGGKTSLEGLSLGTPIVHRPGALMRGRHTLAFYRHMGVESTVVETAADYAKTAIKLVQDQAFRREVREQIAATSERLFGNREAVREIEGVWLDALSRAQ